MSEKTDDAIVRTFVGLKAGFLTVAVMSSLIYPLFLLIDAGLDWIGANPVVKVVISAAFTMLLAGAGMGSMLAAFYARFEKKLSAKGFQIFLRLTFAALVLLGFLQISQEYPEFTSMLWMLVPAFAVLLFALSFVYVPVLRTVLQWNDVMAYETK